MKKGLFVLILSVVTLFAYSDSDLDGVDDALDKCPNTPITDLVDANGCSIKSVIIKERFDIIFGLSYSEINYRLNEKTDTYTTSLQADYYRDNLSFQFSGSYYSSSDTAGYDKNGMNDTTIAAYYRWKPLSSLTVSTGFGIIFPTYESDLGNNKTDYSISINPSYRIDDINLFGGYSYTFIGDKDVVSGASSIQYQNRSAYTLGIGYYFMPKLYASLSFYDSDSIFKGVEDIKNISLYAFYTLDEHWFMTFSYANGLSDSTSDNYLSARVGYAF